MSEAHNVGQIDRTIRLILGAGCVGLLGYHFFVAPVLHVVGIVAVVVLIPFFLKTGLTRVCPVMKAMGVSTNKS